MKTRIKYQAYCLFKPLFFAFFLIYLEACSTLDLNNQVAPTYTVAFESIKGAFLGYPDKKISKELVENIPYASLIMKIGKGSSGLLILESLKDNETIWVSADQVVIVLKEGRIVRTLGLNNNLISVKRINQSFKNVISSTEFSTDYYSYYSYEDPPLRNLKVHVYLEKIGLRDVDILGEQKNLLLIHETISSKEIRWQATNKYWIDPKDYYVWKSEQTISPKLPKFFFEITKKPANL
tara:strand:- start:5 stop:715 length:711 start_codon:yes stop_codon:yes gene_type:complete